SPINALARRFSLPILGGYSHATTCAFNRNPRLKSRVNVAPAIVELGGLETDGPGPGETGQRCRVCRPAAPQMSKHPPCWSGGRQILKKWRGGAGRKSGGGRGGGSGRKKKAPPYRWHSRNGKIVR